MSDHDAPAQPERGEQEAARADEIQALNLLLNSAWLRAWAERRGAAHLGNYLLSALRSARAESAQPPIAGDENVRIERVGRRTLSRMAEALGSPAQSAIAGEEEAARVEPEPLTQAQRGRVEAFNNFGSDNAAAASVIAALTRLDYLEAERLTLEAGGEDELRCGGCNRTFAHEETLTAQRGLPICMDCWVIEQPASPLAAGEEAR